MKQIVNEIASKLRDSLQEAIKDFEGLYVFGSQVHGNATKDSDVDIVVIFGQDRFYQPDAFYDILSQMRYDYYDVIDLDVLPYTREQLQRNYIFHNEVVNKGVFYGIK
ncbi:MAG: nucleotidyltransferase domain-containing protein [Spirochaetes bacterium]|nr:nucleotidyltransferase domain-containing protein [Spirochaetota bacterium]